jgi:tetratricopeptide (TPR) repeat protein
LAQKTYDIAKRKHGPDHPLTLAIEQLVASTHQRPEDAAVMYRKLIRKAKERGESDEQLIVFRHNYALVLLSQGRLEEAEEVQQEVIKTLDLSPDFRVVDAGRSRYIYAVILRARGKKAQAKALYQTALSFQREKLGRTHSDTVGTLADYEALLEEMGEYREALASAQEILEVSRLRGRENEPSHFYGLTKVAHLLMRLGQPEEAVRTINQALIGAQVHTGDVPPDWIEHWEKLLLDVGLGAGKDWESTALRANVWSALDAHLMASPGGADLVADAVDWATLRFRLERWSAIGATSESGFVPAASGSLQELRSLTEPEPGIYRLSLDLRRLVSNEMQQAQSWLLLAPWQVELYGPPDHKLLKAPPAEHRRMSSLVLSDLEGTEQAAKGPGGSKEHYALSASSSIELPAGRYLFVATSDDGVRLYVDGRLVIDSWVDRPPSRDAVVLELGAGAHALRVEYFQGGGGAQLWLQIVPTSQPQTLKLPFMGGDNLGERARPRLVGDLEARLTSEVDRRPNTAYPLWIRARFYTKQGRFGEAAADYAKAQRLSPSDHLLWVDGAVITLHAGNTEEYRRQCREMLSRFRDSTDRVICERVSRDCTILPDAVPDLKLVMEMADRAVAPDETVSDDFRGWAALAKGVVEYRAGHFDAAADWLEQAKLPSPRSRTCIAEAFLAMAEFKRGNRSEAEAALKRSAKILYAEGPGDVVSGDITRDWTKDWIIALHAQREAAALLGHPLAPPTTQAVGAASPSAAEGLNEVDRGRLFRLTGDILRNPAKSRPWLERASFYAARGRFGLAVKDF